jgi:anti-anti-sigma regulatory factor
VEVMPVKRTEKSPNKAAYGITSRLWTGGEYAFPVARRNAIHRPDVRIWAVGRLTVVEFVNVHALFKEEALRELGERLQGLVADGHTQVVLDLSTVRHALSGVVALVARLYREVNEAGGLVRLYGLDPDLLDAIRTCRLDRVVEICVDEDTALRSSDSSSN